MSAAPALRQVSYPAHRGRRAVPSGIRSKLSRIMLFLSVQQTGKHNNPQRDSTQSCRLQTILKLTATDSPCVYHFHNMCDRNDPHTSSTQYLLAAPRRDSGLPCLRDAIIIDIPFPRCSRSCSAVAARSPLTEHNTSRQPRFQPC